MVTLQDGQRRQADSRLVLRACRHASWFAGAGGRCRAAPADGGGSASFRSAHLALCRLIETTAGLLQLVAAVPRGPGTVNIAMAVRIGGSPGSPVAGACRWALRVHVGFEYGQNWPGRVRQPVASTRPRGSVLPGEPTGRRPSHAVLRCRAPLGQPSSARPRSPGATAPNPGKPSCSLRLGARDPAPPQLVGHRISAGRCRRQLHAPAAAEPACRRPLASPAAAPSPRQWRPGPGAPPSALQACRGGTAVAAAARPACRLSRPRAA